MARDAVLPGMVVLNVNPAVLAEFNLPLGSQGVVIEETGPIGARLGLQRGDLILSLNGDAVLSSEAFEKGLVDVRRGLALDVQRGLKRLSIRARI